MYKKQVNKIKKIIQLNIIYIHMLISIHLKI